MFVQSVMTIAVVVSLALCIVDADSALKLFVLTEQGQKLKHVFSTVTAGSTIRCVAVCSREDACIAVSYNNRNGICNLNDRNPFDFPQFSSTFDSAWTSFGREVKCPGPGWVPYNRVCYKTVVQMMSWNTAQDDCVSTGGHLVDILDEMESQFVHGMVSHVVRKRNSHIYYWIGLHVVGHLTHGWVSGVPYNYSRWAVGNPSYVGNRGEATDCVRVGPANTWADVDCDAKRFSVCEKKMY